jgi:putative peptide zinc metalloprotease protein
VVADGNDFVVGDRETRTFISLPEAGALMLRELESGRSVREAGAAVSARLGQEVDALDFAGALVRLGLVAEVDGVRLRHVPNADRPAERSRSLLLGWMAGLLSRPAWALYGALFAAVLAVFAAHPSYWPSFDDVFVYPDPAVSMFAISAVAWSLASVHELCHWSAARAAGIPASISISQRLYVLVLQTDLSGLLALPRRRRYAPLLAGMAFDTVVLGTALATRLAAEAGMLILPPVVARLLAAITLMEVWSLSFQFLVFLRTDMYAVMVTALGCRNLRRITALTLKRLVWRLSEAEGTEHEGAHPRDRSVARWFGVLYLAGMAIAAWYYFAYVLPGMAVVRDWVIALLTGVPVDTTMFWEALGVTVLSVVQIGLLVSLPVWRWYRRRRDA